MLRPALRHALAVAAIAALAATVAGCSSDKGTTAITSGSTSTTAAGAPTTDTSAATTASNGSSATTTPSAPSPLWQPAGGGPPATSAQDAATAFARDYLGLHDPKVAAAGVSSGPIGPPVSSVPGATVVRVQPGGSGPVTSISVVKQGGAWRVVRTDAATIRLEAISTAPGPDGATIVTLKGTSQTFEGNVAVQARPTAWVPGTTEPLAQTTEIGGAAGGPAAFSASLTVPPGAESPIVVVLAEPDASGRGQVSQATAVAMALPG